MRRAFNEFDTDGSGNIDQKELEVNTCTESNDIAVLAIVIIYNFSSVSIALIILRN